jgi:DNA-binding MltR family transcriptional regulator
MKSKGIIPKKSWKKIEYFYKLRCKLYHEDASPTITNTDILEFRELVCNILNRTLGLSFIFAAKAKFIQKIQEECSESDKNEDEDL